MQQEPEIENPEWLETELTLHNVTRKRIRKHLIEIHKEKNLYCAVRSIGLPLRMQSFLLHYIHQNVAVTTENQLMVKTSEMDLEGVRTLIQAGVDVNTQDENGMTALMIAAKNGGTDLIEELVKAGADMNIQACFGDTALICAAKK